MKKICSLLLALCTLAALATGCGKDAETKQYNLGDVMDAIEAVAPVAMPADMDDEFLTSMYGLNMEDVEEYKGKYSNVNISTDEILIIKTAKGKTDAVKEACEARQKAKADQFAMYLEDQALKAQNGRIVVKGDYVIFVIAGDSTRIADGEVDAVYQEIDKAIDDALA